MQLSIILNFVLQTFLHQLHWCTFYAKIIRIISKSHLVYRFISLEEIFKSLNTVHIFKEIYV